MVSKAFIGILFSLATCAGSGCSNVAPDPVVCDSCYISFSIDGVEYFLEGDSEDGSGYAARLDQGRDEFGLHIIFRGHMDEYHVSMGIGGPAGDLTTEPVTIPLTSLYPHTNAFLWEKVRDQIVTQYRLLDDTENVILVHYADEFRRIIEGSFKATFVKEHVNLPDWSQLPDTISVVDGRLRVALEQRCPSGC